MGVISIPAKISKVIYPTEVEDPLEYQIDVQSGRLMIFCHGDMHNCGQVRINEQVWCYELEPTYIYGFNPDDVWYAHVGFNRTHEFKVGIYFTYADGITEKYNQSYFCTHERGFGHRIISRSFQLKSRTK